MLNAHIGGNLFFLELYLKVSSYVSEGIKQRDIKLTWTDHQLAHQRHKFM